MTGVGWLDEAEQRIEGATEGPWGTWQWSNNPGEAYTAQGWEVIGQRPERLAAPRHIADTGTGEQNAVDAEFIAASRSSLPRAVAALRAVLDLHRPKPDDAADAGHCTGCDSLWPCPTVAAIEAAS